MSDSRTVTVDRAVPASPDRVFHAWTDVEELRRWWWPHLAGTTYAVDARAGEGYRIQSPVIGVTVTGTYAEVDRPQRLAFTWRWDDGEPDPVEDTVVVSLEPQGNATLVSVSHTSVDHGPEGQTAQGWNDVLARLAGLFSDERGQ